jgi:hypothetical protein
LAFVAEQTWALVFPVSPFKKIIFFFFFFFFFAGPVQVLTGTSLVAIYPGTPTVYQLPSYSTRGAIVLSSFFLFFFVCLFFFERDVDVF